MWCEHMEKRNYPNSPSGEWLYCPRCGAKRPSKKKLLWERLRMSGCEGDEFEDGEITQYWKDVSTEAKIAFRELVEEVYKPGRVIEVDYVKGSVEQSLKDELLKKLEQM